MTIKNKDEMGWMQKHRGIIISIIMIIIFLIIFFSWMSYHCNKRTAQEDCLRPIAEEYCNNLNTTLIGTFEQEGCLIYFPTSFTCGYKENERTIGYQKITKYKFLEEEINKCKEIK